MTDPVLVIDNLTVGFDFRPDGVAGSGAVNDLSLSVAPGEVVALVGESGAGKTMAARAVVGLLPPTATATGSIRVGGQEVLGADDRTLRAVRGSEVAMVFQEPSTALNPVETVGWQVAEALRAHGGDLAGRGRRARRARRERAVELLRLVDIPEPERRVDEYPHQLSGGQKQRVVIALALANEPRLIIADEPTTALDVTVQAEILRLLRDLRDRLGTAVLLITHNMGVVADLADRVVVLRRGHNVETGDVLDVFHRPTASYTRDLLDAVLRLDAVAGDGTSSPTAPDRTDRPPSVDDAPATGDRPDAVLSFRDLAVDYGRRFGKGAIRAVHDVTLDLAPGEVLGLVGESGSGKSTLGRVAVGLLAPAGGSATVLGVDLGEASAEESRAVRRRIGMVFQDPAASLDPRFTVGDSVAEPLRIHGVASGAELDRRVADLLDAVRLPSSFAARAPAELSGGQRQRVGLARALALEPDLLVADEPTSALDVSVQAQVLDLFRELQELRGFACLFISHDLAVVDTVADRVAVLRDGRLVEVGLPGVVLRNPADPYTRRLLDSVPVPDPVVQRARHAAEPQPVPAGVPAGRH